MKTASRMGYVPTFAQIREEMTFLLYIHTGVKRGNRKPKTYINHLLRLGWKKKELNYLMSISMEVIFTRPAA